MFNSGLVFGGKNITHSLYSRNLTQVWVRGYSFTSTDLSTINESIKGEDRFRGARLAPIRDANEFKVGNRLLRLYLAGDYDHQVIAKVWERIFDIHDWGGGRLTISYRSTNPNYAPKSDIPVTHSS